MARKKPEQAQEQIPEDTPAPDGNVTVITKDPTSKKDGRDTNEGFSCYLEIVKDLGSNLTEAVNLFGEEVVHALFKRRAILDVQNRVRSLMSEKNEKGEFVNSDKDVVALLESFKIEVSRRRGRSQSSPETKLSKAILALKDKGLTPDQIKEALRGLGIDV